MTFLVVCVWTDSEGQAEDASFFREHFPLKGFVPANAVLFVSVVLNKQVRHEE